MIIFVISPKTYVVTPHLNSLVEMIQTLHPTPSSPPSIWSSNDFNISTRYDCGTGMGTLQSSLPARMGEWNILKILREESNATLWLNDAGPVEGSSRVG